MLTLGVQGGSQLRAGQGKQLALSLDTLPRAARGVGTCLPPKASCQPRPRWVPRPQRVWRGWDLEPASLPSPECQASAQSWEAEPGTRPALRKRDNMGE